MSTPAPSSSPPPGASAPGYATPSMAGAVPPAPSRPMEIKLISHSNLFYWWPVWVLAFVMATITYFENTRGAFLPKDSEVTRTSTSENKTQYTIKVETERKHRPLEDAADESQKNDKKAQAFKMRISANSWLGSLFTVVLILTIIITNVSLRGLWSFLVILGLFVIALILTLFNAWDDIFVKLGDLHIHYNMSAYVFIGVAVLLLWGLAVFVFDRRAYIIFTPGQIRYCEHVGASVQAFGTLGVTLEKQRDDLFRHYILGFGSGDLIIKFSTGDRREIRFPNVLGIGSSIREVESILSSMKTTH